MVYRVKNLIRSLSHKFGPVNRFYRWLNTMKIRALAGMSDEEFAKMQYRENTGQRLRLNPPESFNEKLWWLKLNNRDPLLTICSDKLKVRAYVEQCGLGHILVPLYGVYDSPEQIDFESLPERAFIKTNHGSGTNVLYDRNARFNKKDFRRTFNAALSSNYYLQSREWNYKNIEPKILVEKVLEQEPFLIDYKFMCFEGSVKMLLVDIDVADAHGHHNPFARRNIYDREFQRLPVRIGRDHFDDSWLQPPVNYQEMVACAEVLSAPFAHCRVDLYNINGNIFFGEITFYHGGGTQTVTPSEWAHKMGQWIDLTSDKIKRPADEETVG